MDPSRHRASRGRPWATSGLAGVCLAAAVAAQGGRLSPALELLAQVAPIWLAGSALALLPIGWTRSPWRLPMGAVAVLGLSASAALVAPEFLRPVPGGPPTPGAARLRIIQINIGGSGLRRPALAAAWLESEHPDLIFIDDVDPPFRAALERLGFQWRRGTAWTAIASRGPIFRSPIPFSTQDWRTMPDMARALYPTTDGPADLIAVHLARPWPGDPEALAGQRRLTNLVGRYDHRRLIVAGDLNLTPWSFGLRRLDRNMGLERRDRAAFTWPARLLGAMWPAPLAPLDHLYAGSAWRTLSVTVGPAIEATHYPLVVDLEAVAEPDGPAPPPRRRSP